MTRNRFEQVDELQPDAINLTLIQKSDGQIGIIHCPKTAAPDRLSADLTTPEIPVRDAVIGAIELANSKKLPIVASTATTSGKANGATCGVMRRKTPTKQIPNRKDECDAPPSPNCPFCRADQQRFAQRSEAVAYRRDLDAWPNFARIVRHGMHWTRQVPPLAGTASVQSPAIP
jgi:hypothetical protein